MTSNVSNAGNLGEKNAVVWLGVSRLAGAVLVVEPLEGQLALVGETKEPPSYESLGLYPPKEHHGDRGRLVRTLEPSGPVKLALPDLVLQVSLADFSSAREAMTYGSETLARALLIRRNGSVSERLWNIVVESSPGIVKDCGANVPAWLVGSRAARVRDASWLLAVPEMVWDIVRDTVLKCT